MKKITVLFDIINYTTSIKAIQSHKTIWVHTVIQNKADLYTFTTVFDIQSYHITLISFTLTLVHKRLVLPFDFHIAKI